MTLKDTTLPFLDQDCRRAFGPTEGDTLYQQTEARFQALLSQADDRGSPAIRDHLARKLLPPLAFYQVLRARGMDQAAALDQVRQETRQAAQENHALLAEVGQRFYDLSPTHPLYAADGVHPNEDGTQLAAEVLAETILTHKELTP